MKIPAWQPWLLAGGAVLSLGGECASITVGTLGNAQFSPSLVQCVPDGYQYAVPVYAAGGAEGDIVITMTSHGCSQATYQTVQSTHPEVATLTAIPVGAHVRTGAEGIAEIQLLDEHRQLVDTTSITVHSIDRYELPSGGVLVENVPAWGTYAVFDNIGTPLVDTNVTQTTVSGALTMLPIGQGKCTPTQFIGNVGIGSFQVTNGTIVAQMPVQVVRLDQIASVDIEVSKFYSPTSSVSVAATPKLSDGRGVYGAPCQWSSTDPSVTLPRVAPNTPVVSFDSRPAEYAVFRLSRRGSFVVTCTIGPVSANATLTW